MSNNFSFDPFKTKQSVEKARNRRLLLRSKVKDVFTVRDLAEANIINYEVARAQVSKMKLHSEVFEVNPYSNPRIYKKRPSECQNDTAETKDANTEN